MQGAVLQLIPSDPSAAWTQCPCGDGVLWGDRWLVDEKPSCWDKARREEISLGGRVEAHTCLGAPHLPVPKEVLSTRRCLKRALLATHPGGSGLLRPREHWDPPAAPGGGRERAALAVPVLVLAKSKQGQRSPYSRLPLPARLPARLPGCVPQVVPALLHSARICHLCACWVPRHPGSSPLVGKVLTPGQKQRHSHSRAFKSQG
ncbi:hypothetical protein HJG60_008944 [Phyllostomus discolor]|uniref:Uncharacterized protein n=1 Tax=Phyllostomus discolor TaxID=89673 RepID=A0A833YWQ6_9CHIR|nr:hypothetical protein HJG60_008944 [Phyllostomus discolor]